MDAETGSSVTLILYSIDKQWYKEPFLNLLAAAAQMSSFTHCELAIGEHAGESGKMANVLRVFNDATGVELCQRTGINPQYQYVQIGCSKAAERAMLGWAQKQVGKPFSCSGMFWSVIFPRHTDMSSFFCAELVAACLQVGGLMARDSRPGAATPQSLYKLYRNAGAATANPCFLRRNLGAAAVGGGSTASKPFSAFKLNLPVASGALACAESTTAAATAAASATAAAARSHASGRSAPASSAPASLISRRSTSPPRMSFKPLSHGALRSSVDGELALSLSSLSFHKI